MSRRTTAVARDTSPTRRGHYDPYAAYMPPGSLGQLLFFALGRGSLFFRIPLDELDCRGPEKVTDGAFFARSFATDTTSIRAGFVLLHTAHPNVEYLYVYALLKTRP